MACDFNIMNYHTYTSNKTFFTRTVIMDKKVLDENGEYSGNMVVHGNTIHRVKENETEAERLGALEKYFGIRFGEAERDGIRGLTSQLT